MSIIAASAPVRICDCGGWTDTWFARHGFVFHVSVEPRVSVLVEVGDRRAGDPPATIEAGGSDGPYGFVPGTRPWGSQALIEAATESVGIPEGRTLRIRTSSDVPPGASTGTSASVTVALLGALGAAFGRPFSPGDVALAAHRIETERLGRQAGVQDQVAAAMGGVNFLAISEYPHVEVTPLRVAGALTAELDARLVLVYLGRSHDSSDVHRAVIRDVRTAGPAHPALEALRRAALDARDAILSEDLEALGQAMVANTEAQRQLHPMLICPDAAAVMTEARRHGVRAWKVNGAGGGGGSLTLLLPEADPARRAALESGLRTALPACRVLSVRLSPEGLRVTTAT